MILTIWFFLQPNIQQKNIAHREKKTFLKKNINKKLNVVKHLNWFVCVFRRCWTDQWIQKYMKIIIVHHSHRLWHNCHQLYNLIYCNRRYVEKDSVFYLEFWIFAFAFAFALALALKHCFYYTHTHTNTIKKLQ